MKITIPIPPEFLAALEGENYMLALRLPGQSNGVSIGLMLPITPGMAFEIEAVPCAPPSEADEADDVGEILSEDDDGVTLSQHPGAPVFRFAPDGEVEMVVADEQGRARFSKREG